MKNNKISIILTNSLKLKTYFYLVGWGLTGLILWSQTAGASTPRDVEPESDKFPGISMRSGFAISSTYQEELEEETHRLMMRAVAEAAQERSESANFIFAFKHNFLIPTWLREDLPPEVSSRLLDLNMYNIELNVAQSFQETRADVLALLRFNGLEEDLFSATQHPASRFIRLVNETGFEQEALPVEKAKNFAFLAMQLDDYVHLGITQTEANQMMGALYDRAARDVLTTAPETSPLFLADLYASVGQLKRWAAHRALEATQKATYIVESLNAFSRARSFVDFATNKGDLLSKMTQEYDAAAACFEELLVGQGVKEEKVKALIRSIHVSI